MKFKEEILKTGKIPKYDIFNEIPILKTKAKGKPSSKIIETKAGKKAIDALGQIEGDYNYSWNKFIREVNKDTMNNTALFYRGTNISYKEMFERADVVAKSLAEMGIKQGDEIPCCISNTPETVYLLIAANKLGVKLNLFGAHLDKEYLEEIINGKTDEEGNVLEGTTKKVIFIADDVYEELKDKIKDINFENKIVYSLTDSMPKDYKNSEGYQERLDYLYQYENKVPNFMAEDKTIIAWKDFYNLGLNSTKEVIDNNTLDTEFLVTYTSGSTKLGRPKALKHENRSLVTMGVFHKPELAGNPPVKNLRVIAHIHTESNTCIITSISDPLTQGWTVTLEPEFSQYKVFDYLLLNRPNYANLATSQIIRMAKEYYLTNKYDGVKLPFLLSLFAVGEATSHGEEKFINRFLKDTKAGSGVKIADKFKLPHAPLCLGGGDCEHGGIYYTLWHKWLEFALRAKTFSKKEMGLKPVPYVHLTCLKKLPNGKYQEANYNELGILAANSITNFTGYKGNTKATYDKVITDELGRDWVSLSVYGFIDEQGNAHVKGREGNEVILKDGKEIKLHEIDDTIQKDSKTILSTRTVTIKDDNEKELIVINYEHQPLMLESEAQSVISMYNRLIKEFGKENTENFYFRKMSIKGFPLTGANKRSSLALEEMGLKDTYQIIDGMLYKTKYEKESYKTKIKK